MESPASNTHQNHILFKFEETIYFKNMVLYTERAVLHTNSKIIQHTRSQVAEFMMTATSASRQQLHTQTILKCGHEILSSNNCVG